jgi:hypothetical protein
VDDYVVNNNLRLRTGDTAPAKGKKVLQEIRVTDTTRFTYVKLGSPVRLEGGLDYVITHSASSPRAMFDAGLGVNGVVRRDFQAYLPTDELSPEIVYMMHCGVYYTPNKLTAGLDLLRLPMIRGLADFKYELN